MGWAARHLSESERREIARSLFHVVEEDQGGWMSGVCPFHSGDNPSFGYNPVKDAFHCFAGCVEDGTWSTSSPW